MMGRSLRSLSFIILMATTVAGGDWFMYMGNHHLTGNNDGVIPAAFERIWKVDFSWRVFHAISSDGLVFVSGYSREIRCLSLADGKEVWRATVPYPVIRMPAVWGAYLLVPAGRQMLCLDKWSGRVIWARRFRGFSQLASPIVVNGVVYYGNRGAFFARRVSDGRLLWQSGGVMSYGASPLYSDGRLFLQHRDYKSMRYSLLCLDAATGQERWRQEIPRDANVFTPLVYRGTVFMAAAEKILAFAVDDGTPGAVRHLPARAADSPALVQDRLHICDTAGKLHILQPDDLHSVRSYPHHRARGNRFAAVGNRLYLSGDSGALLELNRTNGQILRRYKIEGKQTHLRPLLFSGRVLLPVGKSLHCIGASGRRKETMPDRGILRLLFVHGETGKPLSGQVFIRWHSGERWWSSDPLLKAGRTVLEERLLFPSRMTFQKQGFHFVTRWITEEDRGKLVKIVLKPVRPGGTLVFRTILFNTDSSGLLPSSLPVLRRLANFLHYNPGVRVRIEGHTDSTGTPARNRTLSLERARVVRNYLVRNNIAASRLDVSGLGDTRPVATNGTAAGRKLNRRTEIHILKAPGPDRDAGQRK